MFLWLSLVLLSPFCFVSQLLFLELVEPILKRDLLLELCLRTATLNPQPTLGAVQDRRDFRVPRHGRLRAEAHRGSLRVAVQSAVHAARAGRGAE